MKDIVKVHLGNNGVMPHRATVGSAGYDLASAENVTIAPGRCASVSTGVSLAIPSGCVGLVFERSSLHKHGLSLANKVGVIDSDYRGTILLALRNTSSEPVDISVGDRLAQIVILPTQPLIMFEVDSLDETERGGGGFGSTGK